MFKNKSKSNSQMIVVNVARGLDKIKNSMMKWKWSRFRQKSYKREEEDND